MARTARFKRKSLFAEEWTLESAKQVLGVPMDAEVVRLSLKRAAEVEEFWRFMQQKRRILKPGSITETLADPQQRRAGCIAGWPCPGCSSAIS